jgi:hypothetical protein
MKKDVPGLLRFDSMLSAKFFTRMIACRQTISLVAKSAYKVTQIFEAAPMHIPPLPLHWLTLPWRND